MYVYSCGGDNHEICCKKEYSNNPATLNTMGIATGTGAAIVSLFCPPCGVVLTGLAAGFSGAAQLQDTWKCSPGSHINGDKCVIDVTDIMFQYMGGLDEIFRQCLHGNNKEYC